MAVSDRLSAGLVLVGRLSARIRSYFSQQDPRFWTALTPALVVLLLVVLGLVVYFLWPQMGMQVTLLK